MRLPDPIANTTTEAYLAYKAGVLAEGDLKPKLYEPYIHLDAWLAYWTGLTTSYPVKNVGKNLFDVATAIDNHWLNYQTGKLIDDSNPNVVSNFIEVTSGTTYTISGADDLRIDVWQYTAPDEKTATARIVLLANHPHTFTPNTLWIRFAVGSGDAISVKNQFMLEEGSTATAYEPYTGEPEMLTDEEAYIAYLSGVTDTYPEEFRDPADIRVAAYLKYLVSARFGRPDYPVNNEEFYLSLMKPPVVTNDTPSSDIELDNTCEAPFIDVKMYGDTYQQSYTGKNCYIVANTSSRDIVETVNDDGTFNLVGTASANAYLINYSPLAIMENGATYTWWTNLDNLPSGLEFRLAAAKDNSWVRNMTSPMSSTNVSRTFTANTTGDADQIRCEIWVKSGTTIDLHNVQIQLEKSETKTDFEPFVGGVPAPNPDFPQPVQTVTGRQVVNVQGKNLFMNIPTGSNNGIDFTLNNDGTYDIDGRATAQANNAIFVTDLSKFTDGSTYTLSATKALPSGVQVMFEVFNDSTWVRHALGDNGFLNSSRQSITGQLNLSGGDRLRLTLRVQNGTTVDLENLGVQLELGSPATTYEPYSSNSYEINLGKNLISANWESGRYNDSTGAKEPYSALVRTDAPIAVQPNTTYICSRNGSGVAMNILQYKADGSFIKTTTIRTDNSFTTGADTYFVTMYRGTSGGTEGIQLELGSTITAYAPYFTPIELCKLGTYQDYIYENDGKWYLHKAIGKHLFDGSEEFTSDGSYEGIYQYRWTNNSVLKTADQDLVGVKSDKFMGVAYRESWTRDFSIILRTKNYALRFMTSLSTTIDDFKAWLSSNNTIVYYALDTPTDTEITNQALIDQLNALKNGGSYTGTTYIKVDATDPNLPGLLYVEAPKYD